MKVYVITEGQRADYNIITFKRWSCRIFSEREKAEEFIKKYSRTKADPKVKKGDYTNYHIEEYELDKVNPYLAKGLRPYFIRMLQDGSIVTIFEMSDWEEEPYFVNPSKYDPQFRSRVFAEDESHAIKIVNEKRIAWVEQQLTK